MNDSGLVEMLARQMTAELRAERDASEKQRTVVPRASGSQP